MKKTYTIAVSVILLLFPCSCMGEEGGRLGIPECRISAPPPELHLPAFYTKYVDVNGIPLISSRRVPDSALVAAHRTLYAMTGYLDPKILEAMIRSGARVAVMARYDGKYCGVNTREELKEYDRGLYDILAEYFPGTDEPISLHQSENLYSEKSHPLLPPAVSEQEKKNEETFLRLCDKMKDRSDLPAGELVLEIARMFIGTPYSSGSIDISPEELRVFMDRTDCMLFVEMACCMALTVKGLKIVQCCDGENFCTRSTPSLEHREPSYQLLRSNLRNMRYRCGGIYGYSSRLQAQAPYWYIPQEKIPAVIGQIRDGDLIFFIDRHKGLDIAHMAIACTVDGKMHFIHASSRAGKVIIEPKTLAEYAVNGIRVARLKF